MHHPLLRLVLVFVTASLLFAETASAATYTDRAKLTRHGRVVFGKSTSAKVNVHTRFASISRVCFFFAFEDNLLDPGEEWLVRLRANVGEFGMLNTSQNSVIGIALCLVPDHNAMVDRFLDGKAKLIVTMERPGSMRISKLEVTIHGVPA
jgi:hypothetical protein